MVRFLSLPLQGVDSLTGLGNLETRNLPVGHRIWYSRKETSAGFRTSGESSSPMINYTISKEENQPSRKMDEEEKKIKKKNPGQTNKQKNKPKKHTKKIKGTSLQKQKYHIAYMCDQGKSGSAQPRKTIGLRKTG